MAKYLDKVKEDKVQIQSCKIQQILRSENAWTDRLAKLATSLVANLGDNVHLEMLEAHSIEEIDAVLSMNSKPSWMDPIIDYLRSEVLPTNHFAAYKVKCQAPHYVLLRKICIRDLIFSSFKMFASI